MITQLYKFTKNHSAVHLQWVPIMIHKLYLKKAVKKIQGWEIWLLDKIFETSSSIDWLCLSLQQKHLPGLHLPATETCLATAILNSEERN